MKKLLFILAFLLIPMTAYSTTVTVAANSIANFQPTGLANDVTLSNVSVTNGFTTVSCSACFRPQWVGLSGFRIAISGVDYTVAGVTSTSVLTITTPYAGTTGSDKTVTWYKYVEVRIYADRAFQPAGASYVVQPGVPGSTSWYKRFAASIVNASGVNTLYIPEFTIDSTTDAVGPTNQARYTAGFYRPDGSLVQLYSCFEQFRVPATTPTTWVALCQYNSPPAIVPPANEAYTKAQIDARFPSCTSGQMLYYAATGNAQACLTVGSGLSISGGTITASSSSNLRQALNAVLDYGAVGDGVTDDTTALQNCINASEAAGGKPCYIRAGTYLVTNLILEDNANLIGDGKTKTTIYSTTNSPLVTVSSTANNASIRRMGFKGTKAAGSSQVGLQFAGSSYYYNLIVEDVLVEETGSFGINITQPFSSTFRDIFIDDTAGFPLNYDAAVAPGNTFSQIYVGVTNTGAAVGFRIRSGDFVCIDCNGVNSSPTGGAWASVGTKNGVDGDTADAGARFTCIHCNLESFAAYGIISYSYSKINLLGNTTIAGGGAGTEIALYFDNTGDGATGCTPSPACEYYSQFIARGYIDDTVNISDGYAAYANSQPIHTAKGFPAIQVLGQGPAVAGGLKLSTYRNDTTATTEKLSRADGKVSVQAISTTTTIANPGVKYIEADSTGGAITITIPWGGWYQEAQEPLIIKDVGGAASAFNITLQVGSGANIGSSTSLVMDQDGQTVILMPSGSTGTGAWRILYDSSDSGGITGTTSSGYIAIGNGSSAITFDTTLFYDTANNRLGVGTATPTYDIQATGATSSTVASTGGAVIAGIQASSATSLAVVGALSAHSTSLVAGGTEAIRIDGTTRAVGINNSSPTSRLDVEDLSGSVVPFSVRGNVATTAANLFEIIGDASNILIFDSEGRLQYTAPNLNTSTSGFIAIQTGDSVGATSTDLSGVVIDLGGTRTWANTPPSGSQREMVIYAPVYEASGAGGTIARASTFAVDGPPSASTGVTITNGYAIEASSGNVKIGSSATASELHFYEPSGSGTNYTAFKAQAQSGNVTYTLPAADGTSGQVLSTNGSGTLSWASTATGTIGGSATNTYVAYGSGSNTITGEASFTYNATTDTLTYTKWSGAGLDLDTDVNNTAALIEGSFSVIKNDSNLRTFHGIYVNPVLNTGGSNLQTTVNILSVDTVNTATTGLTTNLLNLAYGGATTFTVTSAGHTVIGGQAAASELRLQEPSGSGSNYTAFKAQAQSGNVTYTLPAADGTSGYCLSTNGSGTLSWVSCAGGGGTIGGSATATYVSYGSGANTITGESAFTYDATNNILSFVKWSGAGLDLDTDVNNTAALVDGSFSIIKNDSNLRTFHGIYVNPVLNTGGSNLQTTVNILSVDTTNTATTGLTTNLLNLAYGGTTVFTVTSTGSMTLADGVKQTFNPNGTNAGINVGSQAGDPSSLANGDIWYNSTSNKFKCRENGSTVDCIGSGSGGLTVGTTAIASGTAGRILYEASGNVLGEAAGITYQTGASPSTTITAQNASYVGLRVNSAATPSTDVFQVSADNGTTTHFSVNSGGQALIRTGSVSAPGLAFQGDTDTGIYSDTSGFGANSLTIVTAGTNRAAFFSTSMRLPSAGTINWTASTSLHTATDVILARATTNVLSIQKEGSGGATWRTYPTTPAQITGDQNNYNPGATSYFQRWSTDASRNITGMTFTATQVTGQVHIIVNVGSNNIVLQHENASSTAANRFTCSTGADITLSANQAADVVYDGTTSRWLVFKRN